MAAEEGLRRLGLVGNAVLGLGLLLIAGALLGWLAAILFRTPPWILGFVPFGIGLSMAGSAILLIAWIVEGFVQPHRPPHS